MMSAEGLTLADWRQRLERCRAAGYANCTPGTIKREYGLLVRQFRELTLRTRAAHSSRWLQQPAFAPVQQVLQQALGLSQLLAEEFQQLDHVPADVTTELLHENLQWLECAEQQLSLADLTHETAEALHPLIEQIVLGGEASSRPVLSLAQEFVQGVRDCTLRPACVPLAAQQLSLSLQTEGWSRAEWFVQAILTARLVSEFSQSVADLDLPDVKIVTAAALLQDLGTWQEVMPRADGGLAGRGTLQEGRRRADPNHPGIGAAILDGLNDTPALLGLLIGSHHERWDGTGFPQRLTKGRLLREARWLGLVVRFVEWITDPLSQELAVEHRQELVQVAGVRLWREVRRGAFSEALATGLLNAIQPGLATSVMAQVNDGQRRMVDPRHTLPEPQHRRHDTTETDSDRRTDLPSDKGAVEAPAFFRRLRDGQRRAAVVPQASPVPPSTAELHPREGS